MTLSPEEEARLRKTANGWKPDLEVYDYKKRDPLFSETSLSKNQIRILKKCKKVSFYSPSMDKDEHDWIDRNRSSLRMLISGGYLKYKGKFPQPYARMSVKTYEITDKGKDVL